MKPWYFEIGSNGPDWYLTLQVPVAQSGRLRQRVRTLHLDGFAHFQAQGLTGVINGIRGNYDWYIDGQNFERFVGNVTGKAHSNIWIYHCIAVENNELRIERGYSGYDSGKPDFQTRTEHQVVQAILDDDTLELTRWTISAGGQGHPELEIRSGSSKGELAAYLA